MCLSQKSVGLVGVVDRCIRVVGKRSLAIRVLRNLELDITVEELEDLGRPRAIFGPVKGAS